MTNKDHQYNDDHVYIINKIYQACRKGRKSYSDHVNYDYDKCLAFNGFHLS